MPVGRVWLVVGESLEPGSHKGLRVHSFGGQLALYSGTNKRLPGPFLLGKQAMERRR